MRVRSVVIGAMAVGAAVAAGPAAAGSGAITLHYSVTRDGAPIGSSTVSVDRAGGDTVAHTATHIRVKFAYWTVYRFDQTETDDLAGDRLVAMRAMTDDNGTVHKVDARAAGSTLSVDADGRITRIRPDVLPVNLWNPSLLRMTVALDPQHGRLTTVSVIDHGEEQLLLDGHPTAAHHYSIATTFPQDVWYDRAQRLVQVEMRVSDGSMIRYRLG